MEEIELLESIKFLLLCKNDCQAIRLIEKYGYCKKEDGLNENNKVDGMDGFDAWMPQKEKHKLIIDFAEWMTSGVEFLDDTENGRVYLYKHNRYFTKELLEIYKKQQE